MWRSAVQICLGLRIVEIYYSHGGLAQLARALAWHARGHRFDPDILHCWHDYVTVDVSPTVVKNVTVVIIRNCRRVAAMLHHAEEIFDILTHETVESKLKNRDTIMYILLYMC